MRIYFLAIFKSYQIDIDVTQKDEKLAKIDHAFI